MKKLTIEQLIMLERLTGRQHTLQGRPRIRPRTWRENQILGIPQDHAIFLRQLRHPVSKKLRFLLEQMEKKS